MTQVEGDSAKPADDEPKQPKRDRTHWLYIMVIVGVVAGVVVGLLAPDTGKSLGVLGTHVRQPDQDDDRAGHLLHDRARHRLGP